MTGLDLANQIMTARPEITAKIEAEGESPRDAASRRKTPLRRSRSRRSARRSSTSTSRHRKRRPTPTGTCSTSALTGALALPEPADAVREAPRPARYRRAARGGARPEVPRDRGDREGLSSGARRTGWIRARGSLSVFRRGVRGEPPAALRRVTAARRATSTSRDSGGWHGLCLADFVKPLADGERDSRRDVHRHLRRGDPEALDGAEGRRASTCSRTRCSRWRSRPRRQRQSGCTARSASNGGSSTRPT